MRERRLTVERLGRGFAWFDAGTHDSLLEAAEFVRVLQRRQGQLVCAPDEIAFHNGWIGAEELKELARRPARRNIRGGCWIICDRAAATCQVAIASSRRRVTAGPNKPMTTNTTTMAPAMKLNTPNVP